MEARPKFDVPFKEGAVRIVRETGKPIAQVARELGISDGTTSSMQQLASIFSATSKNLPAWPTLNTRACARPGTVPAW